MNNVVDEVLNTAETDNKIKYKLTHEDGTEEIVQLDLYTPVITFGTEFSKLLFDSIQTDLNSRVLLSDLATQAEAEAGTNNTKWMTPARVLQEIKKLAYPSYNMSIKQGTVSNNGTIPQTSGYTNYLYFVSPNNVAATEIKGSVSSSVSTSKYRIVCSVDQSTRKVTVGAYQNASTSGGTVVWSNFVGGTANYLELAWK